MKKVLFFLLFLILIGLQIIGFPLKGNAKEVKKIVCYHYSSKIPLKSCEFFEKLVTNIYWNENFNYQIKRMSLLDFENEYEVIYLSGFGDENGFWSDLNGKEKIEWCELLNLKTKILLIDSCYSGMIFKCTNETDIEYILTSTNAESMSFNVKVEPINGYVSSFLLALYTFMTSDPGYLKGSQENYIGCLNNIDPQICQLSIIFNMGNFSKNLLKSLAKTKRLHKNVSIGTMIINGEPWR